MGLFTLGYAQETKSLPLKLTLKIKETKLCVGKKFTILARMENTSDKKQIIDKRLLWRYINARSPKIEVPYDEDKSIAENLTEALKTPRYMVMMGDNFPDDDVPKKDLAGLKPGEFYKDSLTVKGDDEFFRTPGEYTFWSGYGQYADWSAKGVSLFIGHIDSNKLKFTLTNCKTAGS
jgi:hypothetical protein